METSASCEARSAPLPYPTSVVPAIREELAVPQGAGRGHLVQRPLERNALVGSRAGIEPDRGVRGLEVEVGWGGPKAASVAPRSLARDSRPERSGSRTRACSGERTKFSGMSTMRAVAVMACDDEVLPLGARIEAVTDEGVYPCARPPAGDRRQSGVGMSGESARMRWVVSLEGHG